MKKTIMTFALALMLSVAARAQNDGQLQNSALVWQWHLESGQLSAVVTNLADATSLHLHSECFQLELGGGKVVKASQWKLAGAPETSALPVDPTSSAQAVHFAGKQMTLAFSDENDHLSATWQVSLREGANYLEQTLTLRASGGDVLIKKDHLV